MFKELAREKRLKGYNCAQAVVCAFADVCRIDEGTAYRMAEGFGSGIGGLKRTCGAVTGMVMVISLLNSDGECGSSATRKKTYEYIQQAVARFEEMNTTSECAVLLGSGGKLRSCMGCIEDCCDILVDMFGLE